MAAKKKKAGARTPAAKARAKIGRGKVLTARNRIKGGFGGKGDRKVARGASSGH